MGCSLAFFPRLLGHPVTVVANSKLTEDKRAFLRFYGAEIVQVDDFTAIPARIARPAPGRPPPGRR